MLPLHTSAGGFRVLGHLSMCMQVHEGCKYMWQWQLGDPDIRSRRTLQFIRVLSVRETSVQSHNHLSGVKSGLHSCSATATLSHRGAKLRNFVDACGLVIDIMMLGLGLGRMLSSAPETSPAHPLLLFVCATMATCVTH